MNRLPPFSLSARVTAEEAKQDGISLDVGDWFVQGIGNSIGAFVDLLGPPLPTENLTEENTHLWANILTSLPVATLKAEFFGWLFTRPAGNFDGHTETDLRAGGSGSAPRPGAPLAKGKLRFINCPAQGEHYAESYRRKLRLQLFLNPTRFIRHQPLPSLRKLASHPSRWNLGEPNFRTLANPRRRRITDESPTAAPEISLDGNDNVLIGAEALRFARKEAWPIHLRRYFETVESALDSEFRRAAANLDLGTNRSGKLQRAPYYSLKQVETYFEFAAENPIRLLRQLRPSLESLGKRHNTRQYRVQSPAALRMEDDSDLDSPRVLITFRGGRQLRIYAKTTGRPGRLRFEVIHDVKNASVSRLLNADGGGYTTENMYELLDWFPRLARDAASLLNSVFSILQRRSQQPSNSASTYELYGAIYSAVHNVNRARKLMEILVEQGTLRVGRRGSEFLLEIKQLRRKKILESVGDANQVTAPYRAALNILREQDGLPPLATPE